jgi:hypothetical protein
MADGALAGGSGAAASQRRANTWEERLEMGPGDPGGDPGRYTLRVAERAARGSGAAASQTRAKTWEEGLEVGPGDPGRYTVRAAGGSGAAYLQAIGSTEEEQVKYYKQLMNDFCTYMVARDTKRNVRNKINKPPVSSALMTLVTLLNVMDIRDEILVLLTVQQGGRLSGTCKTLSLSSAALENTKWRPNTEIEFAYDETDSPSHTQICDLFKRAYGFFHDDSLPEKQARLINTVLDSSESSYSKWNMVFTCVPTTEKLKEGRTIVYISWPNKPSTVVVKNMGDLIKKLDTVFSDFSPCYDELSVPPGWSKSVCTAFEEWQRKCTYTIDLNKISKHCVLACCSNGEFESVKSRMDEILEDCDYFKDGGWDTFATSLLLLCQMYQFHDPDACDEGTYRRDVYDMFEHSDPSHDDDGFDRKRFKKDAQYVLFSDDEENSDSESGSASNDSDGVGGASALREEQDVDF